MFVPGFGVGLFGLVILSFGLCGFLPGVKCHQRVHLVEHEVAQERIEPQSVHDGFIFIQCSIEQFQSLGMFGCFSQFCEAFQDDAAVSVTNIAFARFGQDIHNRLKRLGHGG